MTTAAAKQPAPDVAQLHARRHKWDGPVNIHRDTSASGCDETERPRALCGLVKITVHPPQGEGFPYRAWRTAGGLRFPDTGQTPLCEGEASNGHP